MSTTTGSRLGRIALAGAAIAAATLTITQTTGVFAAPGDIDATFVPIANCRLFDTRPAPDNVGPRNTPIGPGAANVMTQQVIGTNGNCTIPNDAVAVAANITIANPTAQSNLRVFPADIPIPLAANLNWVARQSPTPNKVDVKLSPNGQIKIYNHAGNVDAIGDLVGYYTSSTLQALATSAGTPGPQGPTGPVGPKGPEGPEGPPGVDPARVLWVAEAGGDYTSVSAALDAIGTTLPAADVNTPYVIRVAPGVYVEPSTVEMKSYVDLDGSGQGVTKLVCECSGVFDPDSATLHFPASTIAQARHLTVENSGGVSALLQYAVAIGFRSNHVASLLHVTAVSFDSSRNIGIMSVNSSPTMTDVTAEGIAGIAERAVGVWNNSSSPTMDGVRALASGHEALDAIGVWNANSSPRMRDVGATATVGGTGFAIAVLNRLNSAPLMDGVEAVAIAGDEAYAIWNSASSPDLRDVAASANSDNIGIAINNLDNSSVQLTGVTATAVAPAAYALQNLDTSESLVRNSELRATTAVVNEPGAAAFIADTRLSGFIGGSGFTCVGAYDANFVALDAACQ